jgi:translocation and assembly module TamA
VSRGGRASALALLGPLLLMAGCANLFGSNTDTEPPPPPPREDATTLVVEAPSPAKELLERNLDLARVAELSKHEALDEVEWLRLVAAVPGQAKELLQTEGYFNAKVTARRERGPPPVVYVQVQLGPHVRVQELALAVRGPLRESTNANDANAREQIQALHLWWPLPPGAQFRNSEWSSAKRGAVARLRAAGYASASVAESAAEIGADTEEAHLKLTLDSGPLFRAGPMRVEGLVNHPEWVVRNLATFGSGAPLTEQAVLDYQESLRKSGLFDASTIIFDEDPAKADAAPVTVQVHELPLQSLTFGVGYSANTGERVTLEHRHRRILGYAATLHNKIEWGRDRQAWEGELSTHPGEKGYRNLLGAQVENLITDVDEVLSLSLRVGRTRDTPRIDRLYFIGYDRSVQTTATSRRDARATSVQYHGIWRNLDSILLPTRGVSISGEGGLGWAISNVGDHGPFTRLLARFTGYLPVGESWYTTGRLELGQIFKRDSVVIPDALAFRAGGDDSVRGYDYRTLAPTGTDGSIIGGNVLGTVSFEVAHPIPRYPSWWGAVFVDAGRAANSWTEFKPALGYGVGARWRGPLGLLRADLAYGEEVHRVRLHLSVGIAF